MTYDDYRTIADTGDYDAEMARRQDLPTPAGELAQVYDPRECWHSTVENLAESLTSVGDVLSIFSPDADASVKFYGVTEAMAADSVLTSPVATMNALDAEIDYFKVSLPEQFKQALSKLDEFLRQNFKPEEVYGSRKRITRPWPYPLRFLGEYWLTID